MGKKVLNNLDFDGAARAVNHPDPVDPQDVATKAYVDKDDAVTNAKLANVPSPSLKGRTTTGTGDPEDLTLVDSASAIWNTATGGSLSIERAALTGDITADANSNVTAIAPGVIVDADINAAAAISQTKTGALTGDVTKAAGSSTTAIAAGVIVNADVSSSAAIALSKLATQAANSIVANPTASTTTPSTLAIAADSVPARVGGNLVSHPLGTMSGAGLTYAGGVIDVGASTSIVVGASDVQRAALTGDVTADQNSNATTIAAGAVSNAKLAVMGEATVKGRALGSSSGAPEDLTGLQVGDITRLRSGSTGPIAGTFNDYAIVDGIHILECEPSGGDVIFTGFACGASNVGAWFWLTKLGIANRIVINHQASGSLAPNRVDTPNGTDLILSQANRGVLVVWNNSRFQVVEGQPGVTWRGTWDNTLSYAPTDVVERNGSSYIALREVPIPQDPSIAVVDGDLHGLSWAITPVSLNTYSCYQRVTVGSSHLVIRRIRVGFATANVAQVKVGIAEALGGTPLQTVFLADTGVVNSPGAIGGAEIDLLTPLMLAPSMSYYVVMLYTGGLQPRVLGHVHADNAVTGGLVTKAGQAGYRTSSNQAGTWTADDNYLFDLTLVGDNHYWDLVAQRGAIGLTGDIGPVGATWRGEWTGAQSYAPTEIVERDGSSFIAVRSVPTNQDPGYPLVDGDLHGFSWGSAPTSLGVGSYYQGIVVGSSHLVVRKIRVGFSTVTAGQLQFGIAATLGATPAATVLIGDTGTVASPGVIGGFEYDLVSAITLDPNTTYYVVARYVSGGQPRVFGRGSADNALTGGHISKSGEAGYRTDSLTGSAWVANSIYLFDLTLIGDNHYWDVVARRGLDAPTDAISNAQLVDMPSPRLKGRTTPSSGDPEDLILVDSNSNAWNTAIGGSISVERAALTGDVTAAANSNATTIAASAVTTTKVANDAIDNTKLANMASPRIKGRTTAATGDPEDLTPVNSTTNTWNTATGGSISVERAALTGDVTAGANSNATTIAANAVDNTKAADMATARLKGRTTAGTGDPEDLTLTNSASVSWNAATGGAISVERAALSGDVTAPANSNVTTIANDAVTNAKAANMDANTIKANPTSASADPQDLAIGEDSLPARVGGNLVSHPWATVAGAGLTYSAGALGVGAGTGITVGANDVAWAGITVLANGTSPLQWTAFDFDDTATVDFSFVNNGGGQLNIAAAVVDDSITNGKLANVPSPSLKGRTTATAGDPEDLTLVNSVSATWNTATGGSLSIERAALTGDITADANSNVTAIAPGVIVDADINVAAAIAQTKTGALTGDITKASGSSTTAIAAGVIVNADVSSSAAISLSKLATQAANSIVANASASTTTPSTLVIAADSIPARVGGNLVSHPLSTLSGAGLVYSAGTVDVGGSTSIVVGASDVQRAALTGDVTADQNSNATTIAAGVVSNAKLFNMADATVKGRPRGDGLGAPSDLTGNQVGGIVRFDNAIGDASTNGTVATYGIQATTNSVTFNAVTNVIHGFTAPAEPGQILCVQHIGAGTTTLVNESSTATSSSDRMRISNYGSNTQALVLGAMGRQTAWFLYTGLRWVYFGGDAPPLAGCGTFQSINLSVGNNDNLGINDGVSIVFFTVVAAGDALVTGLKYGAGGSAQSGASVRCIKATGTGRIVFKHEGATSDAANRLFTPRNVDWVLTYKDESVHIARDTDASGRWRFTGGRTQPNEMTNVELADMPDSTVKGRGVGAGTGDPVDLTGLQLGQILRMDSRVDDASTSGTGTPYTVALGTNWIRFIALTGAYTLDGCDLTTAGKIIIWHLEPGVVGSLVLKHNSGALANGYRFFCPGAVDLTLRSGEVAVTVYTSNRHRVISVSRAWSDAPSENRSITTTETRSDTTRILGPALTIPANTLQVGTVYRFTAHWEFLHTAGADPSVTFDLDLSGSAGTAVTVYPASTAGSFSGATEVILSVRSTGPSGTAAVSKRVITDAATRAVWGRSDSDDVDTTVANTFTLFGKLSSTVAGNSLIVWNSLAERIT